MLEEDRMVLRTIDGKRTSLEVKFALDPNGTICIVHLLCMRDHGNKGWHRSVPIEQEQLFEPRTPSDSTQLGLAVKCKSCGQEWNIMPGQGDLGILTGAALKPSVPYTVAIGGTNVATFTSSKSGQIPSGVLFMMAGARKNANLLVDEDCRIQIQ